MTTGHEKEFLNGLEAYTPTSIVFGDGAFTHLSAEVLLTGSKVLLVVTGGTNSSMKSGAYQAFMNMALGMASLETPLCSGVPAEPDVEDVRRIVQRMQETRPDSVAALGGGSVMDAAKAAYLSWQTGLDVKELFGVNEASRRFPDKEFKRVICIPTTSGTGSEITPYSNIVDRAHDLKYIIVERQITPALALIDPQFTHSMDPALTAATALDAMTHSIESFLNISAANADPAAEDWALEGIRLIHYALPRLLKNRPDSAVEREMLSAAAAYGGMCIACRPTALPHLCSYSMWGKVPHGLAVALLLPHFWRYYLGGDEKIASQTMRLSGIFGGSTPEEVIRNCEQFIAEVSPFKKLSEIDGFGVEMVEKIAADAVLNPAKLHSAPRPVALDEAEKLIKEILMRAL